MNAENGRIHNEKWRPQIRALEDAYPLLSELQNSRTSELPKARQTRDSFCQDFSTDFCSVKRFDRKFLGENWQFEGRELANLSPQFAVKLRSFLNPLIINELQNSPNFDIFVKIIYQFSPMLLSTFPPQTTGSSFRLYQPKTFRRLSGFKGRKKSECGVLIARLRIRLI